MDATDNFGLSLQKVRRYGNCMPLAGEVDTVKLFNGTKSVKADPSWRKRERSYCNLLSFCFPTIIISVAILANRDFALGRSLFKYVNKIAREFISEQENNKPIITLKYY